MSDERDWKGPGERPHDYFPDIMAMGDCMVCGHTYESHLPPKEAARFAPKGEGAEAVAWLTAGGDVTRSHAYAVEQSVNDPDNYPRALVFAHPAGAEAPSVVTDEQVEIAAKAYADATDYYVQFHRGLSSPSADSIRKGIRAALAALSLQGLGASADGWQPIETAPKDGTLVMVGAPGCGVSLVRWMLDTWIDEQGFTQGSWPTHWMPLPPAPSPTAGDE